MRSGAIGALLVLALYASYHFDVIGFELTSNTAAPETRAPVVSGIASSKGAPVATIVEVPATKTPVPVTATRVPESTATPEPAPEATSTPEVEDVEETAAAEEVEDTEEEPTETPEPEPTETPEPEPTAVPATPTPETVAPTATIAVAIGVLVTPVGAPTATATPPNSALRAAGPVSTATPGAVGPGPWTGSATPFHSSLAGNTMGCGEVFNPLDPSILAVGYALDTTVPCGAKVEVCGTTSVCLTVVRKDTCPGCPATDIDLSRAAFDRICGTTASRCTVTIKKL